MVGGMSAPIRFPRSRWGLQVDPIGEYCALDYQGRRLLGEITSVYRDEVRGGMFATVRHFNGKPWPLQPTIAVLEWIRQDG